jgi:hypothetical protein
MQSHPSTRLADCTKECGRAGEGGRGRDDNRGEGGSGAGDEVPTPHNLNLCRLGSREVAAMA